MSDELFEDEARLTGSAAADVPTTIIEAKPAFTLSARGRGEFLKAAEELFSAASAITGAHHEGDWHHNDTTNLRISSAVYTLADDVKNKSEALLGALRTDKYNGAAGREIFLPQWRVPPSTKTPDVATALAELHAACEKAHTDCDRLTMEMTGHPPMQTQCNALMNVLRDFTRAWEREKPALPFVTASVNKVGVNGQAGGVA